MITLTPDLFERKRILKAICHNHTQWKARMTISIVLFTISIRMMGYTFYLLANHHTSTFGIFIFICAGICLSCIPFFIAISAKNIAKYKCALPYSSYANGSLILTDYSLEYIFWRVGPREPAAYSSKRAVYRDENKFVYIIRSEEIKSISFKDDACKIKGIGKVEMSEWAEEDHIVKKTSPEFSFVMAFEQREAEQSIIRWRK